MKKFKKRLIIFFITLFLLLLLFLASFNRLFPAINARALQHSRTYATRIINQSVQRVLEEEGLSYEDLISVNTNDEGKVLSLSSNTININKLKSKISLDVLNSISNDKTGVVKIPIGNLTGMYILSGRGFDLSIRLIPTDSICTTVEGALEEVGINQSWHRLFLKIDVVLGVMLLGKYSTMNIVDNVPLADTVIVGDVPDAYTKLDRVDDDLCGDIVDFMAN